jgi:hypothetical protein
LVAPLKNLRSFREPHPSRVFEVVMHARWCLPLALSLVSPAAFSATPRVIDVALSHPSFHGIENTLMVQAVVTVDDVADDALHDATVGYARVPDYVACDDTTAWTYSTDVQRFGDADTRTWTLYNFVPNTLYRYVVRTGSAGGYQYSCGRLPHVSLPGALDALHFDYATAGASHPFATRYVLVDLDDCGESTPSGVHANLFVLDTLNESIVWYLDVSAMTGIPDAQVTGWRYQPATDSDPARILAIIDRRYIDEWAFDGTLRRSHDFAPLDQCDGTADARGPCAHHDVLTDDRGTTYLLTGRTSSLPTTGTDWAACSSSSFVNDGYRMLDADFETVASYSLMTDYGYDPTVDGGPDVPPFISATSDSCWANTWSAYLGGDVIDWTHVNSIDRSTDSGEEVLDLNVRNFDQILRLDADDGSVVWSLANDPMYSDWRLRIASGIDGTRGFGGEHDVHSIGAATLLFLDNLGDPAGARALRISLDASSSTATIDRSWALVDAAGTPLVCPVEGSAELVPGTRGAHVLAACNDEFTVVELDDAAGYSTSSTIEPPLVISLPEDGASEDFCDTGGPAHRNSLHGFYRAFPLEMVGSFE